MLQALGLLNDLSNTRCWGCLLNIQRETLPLITICLCVRQSMSSLFGSGCAQLSGSTVVKNASIVCTSVEYQYVQYEVTRFVY